MNNDCLNKSELFRNDFWEYESHKKMEINKSQNQETKQKP